MVSRRLDPQSRPEGSDRRAKQAGAGLLLAWRRLLGRSAQAPGRASRSATDAVGRAVRSAASTAGRVARATTASLGRAFPGAGRRAGLVLESIARPRHAAATVDRATIRTIRSNGITALLLGGVAAGIVAQLDGDDVLVVAVTAIAIPAWALIRLLLLYLSAPATTPRHPAVTAWALGLLPFALGATPGLRAVAFVASVWLTLLALEGVGFTPPAARRMTAVAFGSQVLVALGSWILRAPALLLLGDTLA